MILGVFFILYYIKLSAGKGFWTNQLFKLSLRNRDGTESQISVLNFPVICSPLPTVVNSVGTSQGKSSGGNMAP